MSAKLHFAFSAQLTKQSFGDGCVPKCNLETRWLGSARMADLRLKLLIAYDGRKFRGWQSQATRDGVQDFF